MLSSNLQTILDNRLRYLPDITARAIASVDWSTKLAEIAHTYGLHMDEVEDLQSVVMRSMVGMIAPNDFEQSLISALALSPANAEKMIDEINQKVFQPIHDFVMAGGKSPDGMVGAGIHVEEPLPNPPLQGEGAASTTSNTLASANQNIEITNELVLPEISKTEPVGLPTKKIPAPGKFEELFFPQPSSDSSDVEDLFADDSKVQ